MITKKLVLREKKINTGIPHFPNDCGKTLGILKATDKTGPIDS